MSKVSQFFPSPGGGGSSFNRREIFVGPLSTTWTSYGGQVEVNCWGGGGNGGTPTGGSGGGGGGYVRYIYDLAAGDQLSITVGDSGGTSSVSCPTQSPTSPISATGGSTGAAPPGDPFSGSSFSDGGAGGAGSGTVPTPRSGLLLTRSGGSGNGGRQSNPAGPHIGGGGGCAGTEYGDGIDGFPVSSPLSPPEGSRGGNAIGGVGIDTTGGPGNWLTNLGAPANLEYTPWFYSYELIGGEGGTGAYSIPSFPSSTPVHATPGGFLAGGGGGFRPVSPFSPDPTLGSGFPGGYGGGGGGMGQALSPTTVAGSGGVGVVILYYSI